MELPLDWPEGIEYPNGFIISQYNYIPGGIQLVLLGEQKTEKVKEFYLHLMSDWICFHNKAVEVKIDVEENWALGFNIDNQVLLVSITQAQENEDGIPKCETIICLQHIHAEAPFQRDSSGKVILPKVKLPIDWPNEVVLPPEAEILTCGKIGIHSFQATVQGIQSPLQYSEYFRQSLSTWTILNYHQTHENIFLQMQCDDFSMQVSGGRNANSEPFTSFMILITKNVIR